MSTPTEELSDAREAHGELSTSLSIMADKLTEAHAALAARDFAKARQLLRKVSNYVDEMQGYLAAVRDAHHALRRHLKVTA